MSAGASPEGVTDKEQQFICRQNGKRAREQLVTALVAGRTFQEVSAAAPVPVKRAMAYRLLRAVRTKGNSARPRWAAWTSVETARRGTHLSR